MKTVSSALGGGGEGRRGIKFTGFGECAVLFFFLIIRAGISVRRPFFFSWGDYNKRRARGSALLGFWFLKLF